MANKPNPCAYVTYHDCQYDGPYYSVSFTDNHGSRDAIILEASDQDEAFSEARCELEALGLTVDTLNGLVYGRYAPGREHENL